MLLREFVQPRTQCTSAEQVFKFVAIKGWLHALIKKKVFIFFIYGNIPFSLGLLAEIIFNMFFDPFFQLLKTLINW